MIIGILTLVLVAGFNKELSGQNSGGNTQLDTLVVAVNLDTPWEMLWGPDDMI